MTEGECLAGSRKPDFPVPVVVAVGGGGRDVGRLDRVMDNEVVQGVTAHGSGESEQNVWLVLQLSLKNSIVSAKLNLQKCIVLHI